MTNAFMIETPHLVAGIAVRERKGFRFFASDRRFLGIDTLKFRGLREVEKAVRRLSPAAASSLKTPTP